MELPIYDLKISEQVQDDAEVSFVALVDAPAIKRDFLFFGGPGSGPQGGGDGSGNDSKPDLKNMSDSELATYKNDLLKKADELIAKKKKLYPNPDITTPMSPEEKALDAEIAKNLSGANAAVMEKRERAKSAAKFQVVSEDQRIITGPLMIPDQLIYRNSETFGEHYVKFSPETIKSISIKFAKKGYQKNVNLMHDAAMQVEGVTMFESFITNAARGVKPLDAFKDLPDGTWFGSFFVENPEVWDLVKSNQVKGFSVEGMFDYEKPVSKDEQLLRQLQEILNKI